MTHATRTGLVVAVVHLLIVGSVFAKYAIDRRTQPRVWARTAPVDPDLPIRGRYVRLRIEAPLAANVISENARSFGLVVEDDALVAIPDDHGVAGVVTTRNAVSIVTLDAPLAFFIGEHATDPSRREAGEELWVEVTIPERGTPRPIRLGIRRDGTLSPMTDDGIW